MSTYAHFVNVIVWGYVVVSSILDIGKEIGAFTVSTNPALCAGVLLLVTVIGLVFSMQRDLKT